MFKFLSFLSILQYKVYRNVLKIKINGRNNGSLNTCHIWFLTNFFWIDKIDQMNFYSRWTYRSSRGRSARTLIESMIILQSLVGGEITTSRRKVCKKNGLFSDLCLFLTYCQDLKVIENSWAWISFQELPMSRMYKIRDKTNANNIIIIIKYRVITLLKIWVYPSGTLLDK